MEKRQEGTVASRRNVAEIRDISYQLTRALSAGPKCIALRLLGSRFGQATGADGRTAPRNLGTNVAVQKEVKEAAAAAAAAAAEQ